MAFVHGKGQTISVDGTAITAYTDQISFSRNVETAEVTAFGNDDRAYIAGLEGATISLSGHYDATGDAVLHGAFDGASVAWAYSPDGGTTTYSGNAFITNYSTGGSVGERVPWSASLTVTGAVARA